MNDFDWPTHLKIALDSTEFMALATRGDGAMWNHAVYFAYDKELNLYFISEPRSRHMLNIAANSEAAAAIFSTNQDPVDDVIGLQIRGQATILADAQVPAAHKFYYNRSPEIPGIPSELKAYLGPAAAWKFVKVAPLEVGYFDTKHFGGNRQIVPKGIIL